MVDGITEAGLGMPNYGLALKQHDGYIDALRECGLEVLVLPVLEGYPDACFIEDVALCTPRCAVVTRPGADSRKGEVRGMRQVLGLYYDVVEEIVAPGTLDAGDVMMVGDTYYIGRSARTNAEGARQLAEILGRYGYGAVEVPLGRVLHLKTGVTYMEHGRMLVCGEFVGHEAWAGFEELVVDGDEAYAANAVYINGKVLVAEGFPKTRAMLERNGYEVVLLEMGEFEKLDGGLSCLSLRF